jgi:hypothetical protein
MEIFRPILPLQRRRWRRRRYFARVDRRLPPPRGHILEEPLPRRWGGVTLRMVQCSCGERMRHGRPSKVVQGRPRGHAPGVRGRRALRRALRRVGRRPSPAAPQHQAGREHRGLGQGAGPRPVLRQGASEVSGSGLGPRRADFSKNSSKNHSFGGCEGPLRRRRVCATPGEDPLPGTRGPAILPVGSGLRYLPPSLPARSYFFALGPRNRRRTFVVETVYGGGERPAPAPPVLQ